MTAYRADLCTDESAVQTRSDRGNDERVCGPLRSLAIEGMVRSNSFGKRQENSTAGIEGDARSTAITSKMRPQSFRAPSRTWRPPIRS